jgi:thiol-disulfide isomerase/thioredoxin
MMKDYLLLFAAAVAVLLLALLPLMLGCERPQSNQNRGCTRSKVVAFTASRCNPCNVAKPILVQIEAAGVEVQVVDIEANPGLAGKYGVTSVPTYFVYVCGRETVRTRDINVVVSLTRLGR